MMRDAAIPIETWRAAADVFDDLARLEPPGRSRAVEAACGDDPLLRRAIDILLRASDDAAFRTSMIGRVFGVPEGRGPAPAPLLPCPSVIGRWTLEKVIGRGTFGVVYRALQDSPCRLVALKVLAPASDDESIHSHLSAEVRSLARLNHPNIVAIHDAGLLPSDPQRPFLAMELVDGPRITEFVASGGLSVASVVRLMAEVCDAIEHAHQKGVLHRDLKPSNILVDAAGRPKVLDFGVARIIARELGTVTAQGHPESIVGTLQYMSPEQASGDPAAVDSRSDIYSLGLILFECLTGEHPILTRSGSPGERLAAAYAGRVRRLRDVRLGFPRDLDAIVSRCLAREAGDRYQSAGALRDDLERFLTNLPVAARGESGWYLGLKLANRHRTVVGAAISLVMLIGVASIGLAISQARTHRNYLHAQSAIAALLDTVSRALAPKSGTIADRRAALDRVREAAAVFATEHPDSVPAVTQYATLLNELSDVAEEMADSRACLDYRVQAERLLIPLAAHDDEAAYLLAHTLSRMGDYHRGLGDALAARALYERASSIGGRLLQQSPRNESYLRFMIRSDERFAEIARAEMRFDEAEGLALRRLARATELARLRPGHESDFEVMVGHAYAAHVYRTRQSQHAAYDHLSRACALADQIVCAEPDRRAYSRYFVHVASGLATLCWELGEDVEGDRHITAAISVARRSREADPLDRLSEDALVSVLHTVGRRTAQTGHEDKAYDILSEATSIAAGNSAATTSGGAEMRAFADLLADLSACERRLGRIEQADVHFDQVAELRMACASRSDATVEALLSFATTVGVCAPPHLRDMPASIDAAHRAVQQSGATDPLSLAELARAYVLHGDLDEARRIAAALRQFELCSDAPSAAILSEIGPAIARP